MTQRLSFQMYSLRNYPPLREQTAMLRRLGYRHVEPFGGLYDDLDALKQALSDDGLSAPTGHFSMPMVEGDPDRAITIAKALGMETVIVPYLPPQDRPSDRAGWIEFGGRLAKAAKPLERAGLKLAYHNHDFEFVALPDGSMPIEHCLAEGVLWEADLAWVARANADPKLWLKRFAGRVPYVHVKDIAPKGQATDEDGWADVGQGVMGWPELWHAAVQAGAEIMVAEHDNPSDGERFARRSFEAMSSYDREGR